jgi:hypothetical protein
MVGCWASLPNWPSSTRAKKAAGEAPQPKGCEGEPLNIFLSFCGRPPENTKHTTTNGLELVLGLVVFFFISYWEQHKATYLARIRWLLGTVSHTVRTSHYPALPKQSGEVDSAWWNAAPQPPDSCQNRSPSVAPNKNSEARPKTRPGFIILSVP